MIKIYSILHLFVITAISFGNIDSIKISLLYPSYPNNYPYQSHRTTLFINNDNWTEYNIDITKFDHDSMKWSTSLNRKKIFHKWTPVFC